MEIMLWFIGSLFTFGVEYKSFKEGESSVGYLLICFLFWPVILGITTRILISEKLEKGLKNGE